MKVYVLNRNNEPLMPCEPVIARLLLKSKKAKVVKRTPFTIKLLYDSTEYRQDLTLGVDTGSGTFACAVFEKPTSEIVYISTDEIRNDIHKKMERRKKHRKTRRNRKTRYRKPRFLNRKNSRRKNRFSPTMTSKIQSHIKEIDLIYKLLPITRLVLECGKFDPHYLKNPDVKKNPSWAYQHGEQYEYDSLKAMVRERDKQTCQCCKAKGENVKLQVHHIIFRSNGGPDVPSNLITVCEGCHKKIHDGFLKVKPSKVNMNLKFTTQMNSIRVQLLKHYPESIETFGFVTKQNRIELGLRKDHFIDACVIASCGKPFEIKSNLFMKKSISKGDYQKTKGSHSEKRIPTWKINGFRKFDKVKYRGEIYFIKGRMSTGYSTLMNIDGKEQKFENPKTPQMALFKRLSARKSVIMYENPLKLLQLYDTIA